MQSPEAHLHLADGTVFAGTSFGAAREAAGEVVFNTGMSGYVETLTDPSYRGQILVLTYPLQGNYGVPDGPFESARIQVQGLIIAREATLASHYRSLGSLGDWLKAEGIPGIEGVDTRALTRHLRSAGTMQGKVMVKGDIVGRGSTPATATAAVRTITRYAGGEPRILVIDTGAKENIVRCLLKRGATVIRAPFDGNWAPLLAEVDGIVLSNGSGDPADMESLSERIRPLLGGRLPIFGICLGHQVLARAAGASTFKLKYGHRSHNQPVMDLLTRRTYITSQNHGYAVDAATLPDDWQEWFVNLNDGTNEGLRHRHRPFWSVQFHPEAAAGPRDTAYLFDDFLKVAAALNEARRPTVIGIEPYKVCA